MNAFHKEILDIVKSRSGNGTQHTSSDSYLGTTHPRYAITAPVLREIAKHWMREHKTIDTEQLQGLCTSLIEGESSTEKTLAGMLLDCASFDQGNFDPGIYIDWLDHLEGWAEVDNVCTGAYTIKQVGQNWKRWKPVLKKLAKDKNINKRRASLVLLCSPLSHSDDSEIAAIAFENIERLKSENHILITKAISWLLRSMIRHHKKAVAEYLKENSESLPKIAVRETMMKLKTGTKTKRK